MTDTLMTSQLMTPLYASAAMRAIMSDRARLQRMLDFEAALARAEARGRRHLGDRRGHHRRSLQRRTLRHCRAGGCVGPLRQHRRCRGQCADAGGRRARPRRPASFVHWGATSQDVIDTALVLELREAIDALLLDLDLAIKGFTTLAGRHRRTLSVARTLMQHALPMPFGLKLAGYAAALGALARAAAAAAPRGAGAAVRRRRGNARGARRTRHGRGRAARGAARPAVARRALAHPPRSAGRGRRLLRHPRRHLRQDRARRHADDADRGRRGVRAGRARPRRLLDIAAQAQSGRRRGGAVGRDGCAQSRRDPACRPGPGARARARRLAHRLDDVPGAGARHLGRAQRRGRDRRGSRDRRRASARQSRNDRRADHGRGRCRSRSPRRWDARKPMHWCRS